MPAWIRRCSPRGLGRLPPRCLVGSESVPPAARGGLLGRPLPPAQLARAGARFERALAAALVHRLELAAGGEDELRRLCKLAAGRRIGQLAANPGERAKL